MKLNYKKYGSGPDIVILHGLLGMLDNWKSFARSMENDFCVHLLDLRNHGKSPHDEALNYELMAMDVKSYIEDYDLKDVTIIGHSMGGKVAMQLALQYPELLKNLIVVDISPKAYEAGHHEIFKVLFQVDLDLYEKRNEIYDFIFDKLGDEGLSLFLMKNLNRNQDGGYAWKMNLVSIYNNYNNILSAIESDSEFSKPCLFIKGANSNYIQKEDEEIMKQYFPKMKLELIQDAGHWVHAEKPNELKLIVNDFINN